ncbi:MAG: hypothetical protein FWG66_10195 [Spirochaetes bacterium]|nr:hypothetical protein [Spirochaetota bacterium]
MVSKDFGLQKREAADPPMLWDESDRFAVIAFLLLSADRQINAGGLKIDALDGDYAVFHDTRAAAVRDGRIIDELNRVLDGAAYWLVGYLKDDYNGNKKRFLEYLAGKWNIDLAVVSTLEASAKTLEAIKRKRFEIQNGDMLYREAAPVIAGLEAREKAIWMELDTLQTAKQWPVSASVTVLNAIVDCMESLTGVRFDEYRIRSKDLPADDEEDFEDDEESLSEKIGDVIVEGIHKATDIVIAPIEWMTYKIMGI